MGRHRADRDYPQSFGRLTSGETFSDALSGQDLAGSRRRARRRAAAFEWAQRKKELPRWQHWFKGDWWWLAGFFLGLVTGLMALYAGFLMMLTGDLVEVFRRLIGKG